MFEQQQRSVDEVAERDRLERRLVPRDESSNVVDDLSRLIQVRRRLLKDVVELLAINLLGIQPVSNAAQVALASIERLSKFMREGRGHLSHQG